MRIGLVSPYSFDVPGGVQLHVRDLATYLLAEGHEVSVLAPSDGDDAGAPYVTSAGGAMPIRYNGSVARLAFGPALVARGRVLAAASRPRKPGAQVRLRIRLDDPEPFDGL